jgi:hypothetical protein
VEQNERRHGTSVVDRARVRDAPAASSARLGWAGVFTGKGYLSRFNAVFKAYRCK